MQMGELFAIAKALGRSEKEIWKNKIFASMNIVDKESLDLPLEVLVLAVHSCFDCHYYIPGLKVIAYGAGKMAQKYIPLISKRIDFCEIWDAYADKEEVAGIYVVRPETHSWNKDIPIVIFIDDRVLRSEVAALYREKGFRNIFYFRDYIELLEYTDFFDDMKNHVADAARDCVTQFYRQYEQIASPCLPVLFSVLRKDLREKDITLQCDVLCQKLLESRLGNRLTVERMPEGCLERFTIDFLSSKLNNAFELMCHLEIFLQRILSGNVKTIERPMRMANDKPYDGFAISTAVNEILAYLFEDDVQILYMLRLFRSVSEESIPLMACESYSLIKCGEYSEALETARQAMSREPNNLLANETFFQVAEECKSHGIYVEEPVPEYDLSERFCWSGLNFVWCGGFGHQGGTEDFSPCFRPLQCAARPDGKFWIGDDWKEFRKSVTDGSFRYCQKNQCPNIVAGWLPKKSECKESWLRKILDGDFSVIPPIEELHFSYDSHCNIMCPSCRLEIQTNTRERNEELDALYEKNLKPYMEKAKHLTLSGCGEAMISPHSKKVLQSFSREKNPHLIVELRTNATTINTTSWEMLGTGRQVIRHITVSIDASTKDSFQKLRYPAKWESVLQNLEFVQSLRNAGEIDMFEFHVVIQTENIDQLSDIAKMAIHYDADAVTYSRLINWREMSEEEYFAVNPFWHDHPLHARLMRELKALEKLRNDIEEKRCDLTEGRKKIYINIHFSPDPNESYDVIRTGRLKIR